MGDGKGSAVVFEMAHRLWIGLTLLGFAHDVFGKNVGHDRSDDNPMPEFGDGDLGEIIMVGSTPIPAELFALANYLHSIQE